MNREQWGSNLYPLPGWLCPQCQSGHYRLIKDTSAQRETKETRRARAENPDWDEEWAEARFVTLLHCDNPACKEVASLLATTGLDQRLEWVAEIGSETPVRVTTYNVTAIEPPPVPILLSDRVPKETNALLTEAASLYWRDAEAAANKLRQAVEAIMTDQGVARSRLVKTKGGRSTRKPIMLHNRIMAYKDKNASVADLLLAVKWIGNAGSHVGALERTDVLDGFELLDQVLGELYRKDRARIEGIARGVNKRCGPAPKKRRNKKRA